MAGNKKTITRLYRYRNTLYRLKHMGLIKVFSDNLADSVGVTAAQVRKDLSIFGSMGNKRGGYQIDDLLKRLNETLGKDTEQKIIIAGVGNIGRALMGYNGFAKEGLNIIAAFDSDPAKVDRKSAIPVLPLDEMEQVVRDAQVQVGVIAVPETVAQTVLDMMIASGIKGALNFAPLHLNVPKDFVMNNMHVRFELETVIYFVNALNRSNGSK